MPSLSPMCIWRFLKRHPRVLLAVTIGKWVVLFLFMFVSTLLTHPSSVPPPPTTHSPASRETHTPVHSEKDWAVPQIASTSAPVPKEATLYDTSFPHVRIATEEGDIILKMLHLDAPKTVANFLELTRLHFFNDTTLYRYEPNFVLQGGAWPKKQSPLPPVPLEYKVPNAKYFVSTARTADPNSATCEYSIMINDNSKWLAPGGGDPNGYAVFAQVVGGIDTIEKIGRVRKYAKPTPQSLTLLSPPVKVLFWERLLL